VILSEFLATIVYSVVGIVLLLVTLVVADTVFKLNLRHELVEDQNVAFGLVIAGVAVAIGVIIAGTIGS